MTGALIAGRAIALLCNVEQQFDREGGVWEGCVKGVRMQLNGRVSVPSIDGGNLKNL